MFILSFGFISGSKFSQSISPVDHYSFSSVLQSFPNLLVHVIIWFHQFFPPILGKYGKIHNFSWENMERSTMFHGKIWKDPPFSMGKYGNIHHFSREHMERSTIFHGKIWTDPPFFMGNSFTCQGLPGLLVALGPSDTELIPTLNKFIPFQWWVIKTFYKRIWSFFQTYLINL